MYRNSKLAFSFCVSHANMCSTHAALVDTLLGLSMEKKKKNLGIMQNPLRTWIFSAVCERLEGSLGEKKSGSSATESFSQISVLTCKSMWPEYSM